MDAVGRFLHKKEPVPQRDRPPFVYKKSKIPMDGVNAKQCREPACFKKWVQLNYRFLAVFV
jgi:hypothetical protein